MKLSINLNKIALIRNSRGSISPNLEYFARTALEENILGLTAHPRPDNRHIRYEDLELIKKLTDEYQKEFNIEGNPLELSSSEYRGYLTLIEEFKPTQATLVPDGTNQLTSDHGWDINDLNDEKFSDPIIKNCDRCSVFINAGTDLRLLKNKNINAIEIYTGPYADAHKSGNEELLDKELNKIILTAESARDQGLRVNAGHDLDLCNLPLLRERNLIDEVSIGHAIISESIDKGFKTTIRQYINVING
jgi:pyridoxine 5-phosphate synthase